MKGGSAASAAASEPPAYSICLATGSQEGSGRFKAPASALARLGVSIGDPLLVSVGPAAASPGEAGSGLRRQAGVTSHDPLLRSHLCVELPAALSLPNT